MENEKKIKAMLVMLAEYLQTNLTDVQVALYSRELLDLGPEGLATAIRRLQADPSVWAGRFPLPAKLRSYLTGNIEDMAVTSASRILDCTSYPDIARLSLTEKEVAMRYGQRAILERSSGDASTLFAQLRDLLRAAYNKEFIYEPRKAKVSLGSPGSQDLLGQEGADEV